jgi:hypothetical protein
MTTKLALDFRRGKRKITLVSSKEEVSSDTAGLEIRFDRKNPISEADFLKIVAQLRFLLNKMGTSILDSSYKEVERKSRCSTKELEKQHEEQNGDGQQDPF